MAFSTFTLIIALITSYLIPVCIIFLFKKGKNKSVILSINIIWSACSYIAASEVHNFRMMAAIYQPSNQCSHSFNNCSDFLELSVEILERKERNNISFAFRGNLSSSSNNIWPPEAINHIKITFWCYILIYYRRLFSETKRYNLVLKQNWIISTWLNFPKMHTRKFFWDHTRKIY